MIIILEPEKDTYVTNLKTSDNDGSKSNVGHAATLDLFKLYNENKHAKSWAAFKFTGTITDGKELKLTDTDNNTVNFIFKTNQTTVDGSLDNGKVIIGIQGIDDHNDIDPQSYSARISTAINNVSTFNNDLTLGITASSNSNKELILKQNKAGSSGDTTFTLPDSGVMSHIGGASITKFSRIDYSAILIKFNLLDFKNEWIELIDDQNNDGIDDGGNTKDDLPGAFRNLKAELVLKDVTSGISKPKNYTLEVLKLQKDFKEGTGKDTIYFSDKDDCNFKDLDTSTSTSWEVSDFVSTSDAQSLSSSFNVILGNENLTFDVTSYVIEQLKNHNDKGFLIKFSDSFIYNNKSYFAKRTGSRHLINKKLIPELRIKINDSEYNIPIDSFNKKRYLNNIEDFYLFNNTNGNFSNFSIPGENYSLKLKIKSKDNKKVFCALTANSTSTDPVVNFKGNKLSGIRKVKLTSTSLSKFNSDISSRIKKDKLEANYEWVWSDDNDTSYVVNSGNFVTGRKYKIKTIGTTNFSLIGGDSNPAVDELFYATGSGTGTGEAYEVEQSITSKRVDFYVSESSNEEKYKNLITSIKVNENKVIANNSNTSIEVYFTDTKKEFDAVKLPYELPSENLGNVFYQIYDVETDNVLIDYDTETNINATKLYFDGEKYIFNLFVPKSYKNTRINFKFMYKDTITKAKKYIFNQKFSVRIE